MEKDPSQTPALEPPDGVVPNFVDPPSIHNQQVIIGSICLSLSVVAAACRTLARTVILKKFDLSDGALLLSIGVMVPYVVLTIWIGTYGQGRHQWNVPLSNFLEFLKIVNVLEILYGPMMFFAKYVVLRQIHTIFLQRGHHSISERGIMILIWGNLLFYSAFMLSFICACIPREKIWNPTVEGRCIDINASLIASSAINMVSDLTILILPLVTIWRLHLPVKYKVGPFVIFSIGILATIASIIRLHYTLRLTESEDTTYTVEPFAYWTHIEFTTVVFVASAPLFPLIFRRIVQAGTQLSSLKGSSKKHSAGSHPTEGGEHSSMTNLRGQPEHGRRAGSRDTELADM